MVLYVIWRSREAESYATQSVTVFSVFFHECSLTPLYKPVKPSLLITWLTICIMFLREPSWGCVCSLTFTLSAAILFCALFRSFVGRAYLDCDNVSKIFSFSIHMSMSTRLTQIKRVSNAGCETAGTPSEPQWVVDGPMLDIL